MDPVLIHIASIVLTNTHGVNNLPASAKPDCVLILRDLTITIAINAIR